MTKNGIPLCAVILALLFVQQSSTQTTARQLPVVDGVVTRYHAAFYLGCGLLFVPVPENLAQTKYFQSLGDAIQADNRACSPRAPLRATIFVIQTGERLDVKMQLVGNIEMRLVESAGPTDTPAQTQAMAGKINKQLTAVSLTAARF